MRELHPVGIQRPKEVVMLLGILPGLGNIHGHPTHAIHKKLRPAVIAGYRALCSSGHGETYFEPCRDSLGARQRDEQRMEIGAIAVLGIAHTKRIAAPPAGS